MDLAAGRGRTGVGLSFPVIYLQWGPGRCKERCQWQLEAVAEVRVSLLWLWPSQTSALPCFSSSSCRQLQSHVQSVWGKFCLSSCGMGAIKAQFCSWSSQSIPHGFLGLKAVMCGKATLPGPRALEFRGKWGSCPFIYFHCCLFLYFPALRSRSRGTGQLLCKIQYRTFTLCHLWACTLSDRIDSVGAAALLMFPFMFMFVPTEWPLAQTTWTCITRKLTTLEPPVCHYPS